MSERQHLPTRRGNISIGFEFEGHKYRATAGHFADGRLGEIFLDTEKAGTQLQLNANTAAILASLCLQHGIAPDVIAHSISGPIAIALAEFQPDTTENT
jgi:hypothetical protein